VLQGKNVTFIKGNKLVSYLAEKNGMSAQEAEEVGNALLRENLVLKAGIQDKAKKILRINGQNPKQFDENAFLVWNFEASTGMRNLLLLVIVLAFFGLVLFPVWPQSAKVGVWYISMTLLLVLLGFIIIRLVLFLVLYAVGIDFWILPNFFADDLGILESFRPTYSFNASWSNAKETWYSRAAVVAFLAGTAYWVSTQPTDFDEFVASQRSFVEELYEGTLLADKSQKEKEQIDKAVPDMATLQKEIEDLEKLSEQTKAEEVVDQKMEDMLQKEKEETKVQDDDDEEIADL
jgi:translocation protein SEC62